MKPLILLALLLTPSILFGQPQQSTDFRIIRSVIDGGGTNGVSQDFRLTSAYSQPSPLGLSRSVDFVLSSGFLASMLSVSPLSPIQDLVIFYDAPYARLNWSPQARAHSYKIYRDTNPLFVPDSLTFLAATTDTFFVDTHVPSPPKRHYYYAATAINVYMP